MDLITMLISEPVSYLVHQDQTEMHAATTYAICVTLYAK